MMEIYNGFTREYMYVSDDTSNELVEYIARLEKRIRSDAKVIASNKKTIEELNKKIDLVPKVAGRREKLTFNQKENIRKMRSAGVSLQEIADAYKCSVPLVHKITKDLDIDLRKKGSQKAHIKKD